MNANELADIVDHWAWKESAEYLTDAATMLRQLEAENQELKTLRGNSVLVPCDALATMQATLAAYKQVLESIANEKIELSHDKIKFQCEDHIRWAKKVLDNE